MWPSVRHRTEETGKGKEIERKYMDGGRESDLRFELRAFYFAGPNFFFPLLFFPLRFSSKMITDRPHSDHRKKNVLEEDR